MQLVTCFACRQRPPPLPHSSLRAACVLQGDYSACIRCASASFKAMPSEAASALARRATAAKAASVTDAAIPPLRGADGEVCSSPVVRRQRSKHFPSSPAVLQHNRTDSTRTSWPINRRRSHDFVGAPSGRGGGVDACASYDERGSSKRLRRSDEAPFELKMLKGALEEIDKGGGEN